MGWWVSVTMLVIIKLVRNEFPVSKHMQQKYLSPSRLKIGNHTSLNYMGFEISDLSAYHLKTQSCFFLFSELDVLSYHHSQRITFMKFGVCYTAVRADKIPP